MALLHSNGHLRTERDGDTEKGCQKPALQQNTTDDDDDDDDVAPSSSAARSCGSLPTRPVRKMGRDLRGKLVGITKAELRHGRCTSDAQLSPRFNGYFPGEHGSAGVY